MVIPITDNSLWLERIKADKEEKFSMALILMKKAYEAIGYWTAKLEEMIRNQKSSKSRTDEKEKRKAELKEWMKTMTPKERHLKGMQEWDVTERTILMYEQEIRRKEKSRNAKEMLQLITKEMEEEIRQRNVKLKAEDINRMKEIKRNPKKYYSQEEENWKTENTAFLRKYTNIT